MAGENNQMSVSEYMKTHPSHLDIPSSKPLFSETMPLRDIVKLFNENVYIKKR